MNIQINVKNSGKTYELYNSLVESLGGKGILCVGTPDIDEEVIKYGFKEIKGYISLVENITKDGLFPINVERKGKFFKTTQVTIEGELPEDLETKIRLSISQVCSKKKWKYS